MHHIALGSHLPLCLCMKHTKVRRFPPSIRLVSHPEISDNEAISKQLADELFQYARKQAVSVMGSVSSVADVVWSIYPDLIEMKPDETPGTVKIQNETGRTNRYRYGARFNFCPSKEATYQLLFDLIDELAPLFTSEFFDLGIDEVGQYQNGSRWVADDLCRGKDPVRLFAEYTNRLADYVIGKGKIPVINSTPFIKEHGGAYYDIYRAVALIRKNIVINNWSESIVRKQRQNSLLATLFGQADFSSTEYFAGYGLKGIIHMVQAGKRWADRPELQEQITTGDCYGAIITHYTYMTGEKIDGRIVDEMSFSGDHFWSSNRPPIDSEADVVLKLYASRVVENVLKGEPYVTAIAKARMSVFGK